MGKIAKYLNQLTVGNVFDTPEILEEYSTDRSVLKIKPKFVAFPESTDDIRKLMRFFNQLAVKDIKVAVTARGSGMDKGGADLTNGVVISTEKLNRLLEIDSRERLVRVQSGITLRELNTALSVSGLQIPIDGHDEETIGGLISKNTKGDCAGKYGGIYAYVERIEVVLANGECLQTERFKKYALAKRAAEKSFEGEIYRKISKLLKENKELIEKIGKDHKDMAGYPMIAKAPKRETLDLMPLFFGAEGTLGIISEVILRAIPLKKRPERVVATFKEIDQAIQYAEAIEPLKPRKMNLFDLRIIMEAREAGKNLDGVIRKLEDGFVVFANFDERPNINLKKIMNMRSKFPRSSKFIFESVNDRPTLNEFENSLTNYLAHVKNGERVPILTDFYLPRQNIKNFLEDLQVLEKKLDLELELFGSLSSSIYSLRPKFKLDDKEFNKKATMFLRAGAFIINRQGGELAGGAPEGRLKAVVTNANMLEPEKIFYGKIKEIFDRNEILNPDIKLGAHSKFTRTHFRTDNLSKIMV
ncbi:FAD-binding oxidoreductase [Candidatus Saccharibacteria bacterium]|nr:FAD-binding oxidoreductase [Candidatus Saccharibacteria bacterium]